MKKIALGVSMLALAGGLVFAQQAPPAPTSLQAPAMQAPRMPASPPGQAATQVAGKWASPKEGAPPRYSGGKWLVIDYGRPILRGRQDIFGSGADYGKQVNAGAPLWRAGANVTTRLRTEVPLVLGGKTLNPGEYSLFVELKPAAWTLVVSTQPFQQKYDPNNKTETWGAYNYDPKFDVVRVPMTVKTGTDSIDQFTIQFVNVTDTGGTIQMQWEKTIATVPFKVG